MVRISLVLMANRAALVPKGLLNVGPLGGLKWAGVACAAPVPATSARAKKGRTRARHNVLRTEAVIFRIHPGVVWAATACVSEPTTVAGSVAHHSHQPHHSHEARVVGQAPQTAMVCRNAVSFARVESDRVILRPGCA